MLNVSVDTWLAGTSTEPVDTPFPEILINEEEFDV